MPVRTRVFVSLIIATAVSGCATAPPHLSLAGPAPTAAPEARVAAYERLRPGGSNLTLTAHNGQGGNADPHFILRGHGQRVHYADDLVPVVAPDSATATTAVRSGHNLRKALPRLRWGMGLFVGGGLAAIGGGTTALVTENGAYGYIAVAGAAAIIAGGVTMLSGFPAARLAGNDRVSAFATYDGDLRHRLGVCVQGLAVVACDVAPARATPPAPPAPRPPVMGAQGATRPIETQAPSPD